MLFATSAHWSASPQCRPSYQLVKLMPFSWLSRWATQEVHWPWKKPRPSSTQPPVVAGDSSQSGANGQA